MNITWKQLASFVFCPTNFSQKAPSMVGALGRGQRPRYPLGSPIAMTIAINPSLTSNVEGLVIIPGLFHVTIVRPYGPIFDVYTSVQSHVTYLRLRGYVTTAVKKYELM